MLITDDNYHMYLMAIDATDDIIGMDTETTGLDVRNKRDYQLGFSFSVDGVLGGYVPFRHPTGNVSPDVYHKFLNILKKKDQSYHNKKFDDHSWETSGVHPDFWKGEHHDSYLSLSLIDEEMYSKELDYAGKQLLGMDKIDKEQVNKWGDIFGRANLPPDYIHEYATQDAHLGYRLTKYLLPILKQQELEDVYSKERRFSRLLWKIEQRGVGIILDFCKSKAERGMERMATIEGRLGFNPASPKDLSAYLLDELGLPILKHTKSCKFCTYQGGSVDDGHEGPPSFDKTAMEDYDDILSVSENPTAKLVSEFRGWQKAVSSLYLPMLEKVGPDGRIRTDFKQGRTVTGRLSSSDPNLQQIPRESNKEWNGDAKHAFYSGKEGFGLFGWDYSQIEFRFAASYGREELLLNEFSREDADPFSRLAPLIFGTLTPETRFKTKHGLVYPSLYGAGIRKIAASLGYSDVEEVRDVIENYKATIPGIMAVSRQVDNLVKNRGWVRYWDGRRRHFRNKSDSYKAWNSLLQGGAAQLLKSAMLRCEEFESDDCQMVLTVHDEITFIINREKLSTYKPLIEEAMTDWPGFGVKLAVEMKEWGK